MINNKQHVVGSYSSVITTMQVKYTSNLNCFVFVRFVCVGFIGLSNIFMLLRMDRC